MKQPYLGIVSLIASIAVAMLVISRFSESQLHGWVSVSFMSLVPSQLMISWFWKNRIPCLPEDLSQPKLGVSKFLVTILMSALGFFVTIYFASRGPTISSQTIFYLIITIAISFLFFIVWQGWPFPKIIGNSLTAAPFVLIAPYMVSLLLFWWLCDFSESAPGYSSSLDPNGVFPAWTVIVFSVTTVAVVVAWLLFDQWPSSIFANKNGTLILSFANTIYIGFLAVIIYYLFIIIFKIDQVIFMTRYLVPFIFATFIPLSYLEGGLLQTWRQPLRGVTLTILCCVLATLLKNMFLFAAPLLGESLPSGAPDYRLELWLAAALLAVTFPIVVLMVEQLEFWPFRQLQFCWRQKSENS